MNNPKYFPNCNREDCFACKDGKCELLTDNDFGKRECPFYKTEEEVKNIKED